MPMSYDHRRFARSRRPLGSCTVALEPLERRDCPAVVGIAGTTQVSELVRSTGLTFTLSAPDTKPVSVDYRISGSATSGQDFRLFDGKSFVASPTGTITFKPGETSKTLSAAIVNDTTREPTESFSLTLFKPRNCTLGSATAATVTITDDDSYTAQIVGAARIAEGQTGDFELRLSAPATKQETFSIDTIAGSASAGTDYRPLSRLPVVFNAGETSKRFRVQALADTVPETDEFFFLKATPAAANFPAIAKSSVLISGTGPAPLPQISIAGGAVLEGDTGATPLPLTISLSATYYAPITVSYSTVADTATAAGGDYQPSSGVVTIPAGDTSTVIVVNALGDIVREPDETFKVVLASPVNATLGTSTALVTIIDDDTPFRIDVVFPDKSLSGSQQLAFRYAAVRWAQIITADLPDVTVNGRVIDDLEISATGPAIDGPYGILGQAGPRGFRTTGSRLPYSGVMEFDSADLGFMESNGTLGNVILHEMGHVLGIGTMWATKNLLVTTDPADPQYSGANALREYRQIAGNPAATGVPVENTGGSGTAGAHWRESVFDTELMTGYAELPAVAMPISTITVGSLQDLGYTVNYAAADPYTLPGIVAPSIVSTRRSGSPASPLMSLTSQQPAALLAALGQAALETSTPPKQRAFAAYRRA
jgi:hypothetical protein